ncbi:MAG: SAM-dependent chlorinase/fluorinase [Bacteroidales bacterium]|nr:SAM-dependent chlorinase/fluorinase [Bacteroidales bacterium]
MTIITLTTDWQNKDFYAAVVKAKLLSHTQSLQIIDISHTVPHFNILNATFIIEHTYKYFPNGTIHLISVESEQTKSNKHVIVKAFGQYFIGADNGLFFMLFNKIKHEIFKIKNKTVSTFVMADIFVPAALHLIDLKNIDEIAETTDKLNSMYPLLANYMDSTIEGQVIYIDSFGNAITNISKELFENHQKNRKFKILPGTNYYKIKTISKNYNSIEPGEILGLFNSQNLLELAINKGNITELINLKIYTTIRIIFYDN